MGGTRGGGGGGGRAAGRGRRQVARTGRRRPQNRVNRINALIRTQAARGRRAG